MFPAGRLDRPVVIQSLTETVSPGGAAVQVWTDFASVWAAKQEVTARERFRASQEIGEEVAVFTVRWRDDITSDMRLLEGRENLPARPAGRDRPARGPGAHRHGGTGVRPEAALRQILIANAGVAAIVGTRVYRNKLPQNVTYPAIRFQLISTPWAEYKTVDNAPVDYAKPRFQIDCFAVVADGELALADAVRAGLDGYHGTVDSPATIRVDPIEIEDEDGGTEEGIGPGGADVFRERVDVFFPYSLVP